MSHYQAKKKFVWTLNMRRVVGKERGRMREATVRYSFPNRQVSKLTSSSFETNGPKLTASSAKRPMRRHFLLSRHTLSRRQGLRTFNDVNKYSPPSEFDTMVVTIYNMVTFNLVQGCGGRVVCSLVSAVDRDIIMGMAALRGT